MIKQKNFMIHIFLNRSVVLELSKEYRYSALSLSGISFILYNSALLWLGDPYILDGNSFFSSWWLLWLIVLVCIVTYIVVCWLISPRKRMLQIDRIGVFTASMIFSCIFLMVTLPQSLHIISNKSFECSKNVAVNFRPGKSKSGPQLNILEGKFETVSSVEFSNVKLRRFYENNRGNFAFLADVCGERSIFGFTVTDVRPIENVKMVDRFNIVSLVLYNFIFFMILLRFVISPIVYVVHRKLVESPIPKEIYKRFNIEYENFGIRSLRPIDRFIIFRYFIEVNSIWLICLILAVGRLAL
jgi:hypothetical protein